MRTRTSKRIYRSVCNLTVPSPRACKFKHLQVSVVVNYDLPRDRENYVHRIGRGGRFGRKAVAINLVVEDDVRQLRDIQQYWACQIEPLPNNLSSLM